MRRYVFAITLLMGCSPGRAQITDVRQEVYQRSVSLEGNAPSGSFDAGKKKFPWFQKDK